MACNIRVGTEKRQFANIREPPTTAAVTGISNTSNGSLLFKRKASDCEDGEKKAMQTGITALCSKIHICGMVPR